MLIRYTDKEKLKFLLPLRNKYRKDSSEWKNINAAIRARVFVVHGYDSGSEEEKVFDILEILLENENSLKEINDRIVEKICYLYDAYPSEWRKLTKILFSI